MQLSEQERCEIPPAPLPLLPPLSKYTRGSQAGQVEAKAEAKYAKGSVIINPDRPHADARRLRGPVQRCLQL